MSKAEYPREVVLSNGDKFAFPDKFKGKHKRNFNKITIGIENDEDIMEMYPEILALFAESAISKDGVAISVTNAYLDELDVEDYRLLIDEGVDKVIFALNAPKVK